MTFLLPHSAIPVPEVLAAPRSAALSFRLLGPVEVETADGRPVPFARRQERALLAILLLRPGMAIPVDRLCEGTPPHQARRLVHTHVSRIRAVLSNAGHAEIVMSHRHGYSVTMDEETVDAHRFRALLSRADAADDRKDRERVLREAPSLWRGPALHNAASSGIHAQLCADALETALWNRNAGEGKTVHLGYRLAVPVDSLHHKASRRWDHVIRRYSGRFL